MDEFEKLAAELGQAIWAKNRRRDTGAYPILVAALRRVHAEATKAEREACAKIAQDRADWCRKEHQNGAHFETLHAHERSAEVVAGRIRARGTK